MLYLILGLILAPLLIVAYLAAHAADLDRGAWLDARADACVEDAWESDLTREG